MGGQKFGPYDLVRPIASGGMAELYLVKAQGFAGFEKFLALKVIHPDFASDVEFVSMLVEEAKLAVQLQHGNIAQTFDLGRVGDIYYIAMEFVDGVDLYKVLRYSGDNDQPLPLGLCAYVVREALHGLDYAHRKTAPDGAPLGIVHRDISPQNILVSYTGEIKLVDFGIAKASMRAKKTAIGVLKGKYYYMSPEQAWGEPLDARSDIFSMGIVLYELLVGQMLFVDDDLAKVLEMVRKADIKPPSHLRPDIPAQLDQIIMKALAKRPDDRFPTAIAFANALDQFLRTVPLMNAVALSDYIRHRVAPGEASLVPTREDGQVAAARATDVQHGAAVPHSKITTGVVASLVAAPGPDAGSARALTTPMRVRQVPPIATERKISSYADTNRIMLDREIDDTNSLIFTDTDLGRDGIDDKLEAAREQFRRESLGGTNAGVPQAPMATQQTLSARTRARRASEHTAIAAAPVVVQPAATQAAATQAASSAAMPSLTPTGAPFSGSPVPVVPTPAPQQLPEHLTLRARIAVSAAPPMSLAASAPVLVPAPGGSRGAWTPHALIAWTAAFAALGIAVAVGFAWWQTHLGPARVWVDATVDGAEVSIDDGAPRSAGAALMLAPGASHTVSITKPGYKKVTRHVVVERGQTAYIMASMRPIPALSVRGPSGLEVFVNDVVVGATPLSDVAIEGEGLARITVGAWHWSVDLDQTPVVRLEVPLPW